MGDGLAGELERHGTARGRDHPQRVGAAGPDAAGQSIENERLTRFAASQVVAQHTHQEPEGHRHRANPEDGRAGNKPTKKRQAGTSRSRPEGRQREIRDRRRRKRRSRIHRGDRTGVPNDGRRDGRRLKDRRLGNRERRRQRLKRLEDRTGENFGGSDRGRDGTGEVRENGNTAGSTGDAALRSAGVQDTGDGGPEDQELERGSGAGNPGRGPGTSSTVRSNTLLKTGRAETGAQAAAFKTRTGKLDVPGTTTRLHGNESVASQDAPDVRTHGVRSEYLTVDVEMRDPAGGNGGNTGPRKEVRVQGADAHPGCREAAEPGDEVRSRERQEIDKHRGDARQRRPAQRLMKDTDAATGNRLRKTGAEIATAGNDKGWIGLDADGNSAGPDGRRENTAVARTQVHEQVTGYDVESACNRSGNGRRNRPVRGVRQRNDAAAERDPTKDMPRRGQETSAR